MSKHGLKNMNHLDHPVGNTGKLAFIVSKYFLALNFVYGSPFFLATETFLQHTRE